ncbi:DUF664 domain-containing protein [Actinoplanes sp. NPDC049596]|uniref:mycothiol transferase n=1 Tax=unclassified Actinoplanes TaxID=2626549 RepID=UPI003446820C
MSDFPQLHSSERDTLAYFLDQHRERTPAALDGLADADAAARLLPATDMTIGGIVKHLAHMEDLWFTHTLLGEPYPEPWASAPPGEEWAWRSAAGDSVAELRELYEAACARSRDAVSRFDDLDARAARPSFGKAPVSLRWLWAQMIRETAQHNGHLDLMLDVIRAR